MSQLWRLLDRNPHLDRFLCAVFGHTLLEGLAPPAKFAGPDYCWARCRCGKEMRVCASQSSEWRKPETYECPSDAHETSECAPNCECRKKRR